ncbi:MAG: PQQ-binding-like beta-propeller repeat protein [Planctomycetes bacterium]|nr:PQQ-binding-like beta-propeller repeat protein [Planctomycetota bacterium]
MPAADNLQVGPAIGASSSAVRLTLAICLTFLVARDARGQDPTPLPRPTVSIDLADNATLAHLDRFDALLAEQQWQEAVETIRQVAETSGKQLVRVTPEGAALPARFQRYLPLSDYGQAKIIELARHSPEALALYRRQVDSVASRLFESGRNQRDEAALIELVTKYFASSYTDRALLQLGEIAMERGNWNEARGYWEQISPLLRFPPREDPKFSEFAGQPRWLITRHLETEEDWKQTLPLLRTSGAETSWLAYRDTHLALADISAKLTLVSILEGNLSRTHAEIELMRRLFPDEIGVIGGEKGNYVALLQALLEESQQWPASRRQRGWPTFAGSNARQASAISELMIGTSPRWQLALPTFSGEGELIGSEGTRVAESRAELLSYHPIVAGDTVIVQAGASESDVFARRLDDGSVIFGVKDLPTGTVAAPGLRRSIGVPRFPLSSSGRTVYARVGSLPTGTNVDLGHEREEPARIIGLGLESEGRLVVELRLEGPQWDADWAFDGVPISDGELLYIALRHRSSVRTENYVACFDARTTRLQWRRMVVGAEPLGSERPFELSHTLLTLRNQTLYCNTNLGIVAALSTEDGSIKWLTEYPRVELQNENPDRNTGHLFRDLTPCLLYRDLVITAPMDCDQIFALDANTGIVIWASFREQAADAIHLLGVGDGHLIVSGDYLYWFDVYTGQLLSQFPAPHRSLPGHAKPSPHGHGRGILADKLVYWPTRQSIFVFDQRIRPETRGRTPIAVRQIDLTTHGATGGNLVLTDSSLIIAAQDRLIVFDRDRKRIEPTN